MTWIAVAIVGLFLGIGIWGIWKQLHPKPDPFKNHIRETYYNDTEDDTKP